MKRRVKRKKRKKSQQNFIFTGDFGRKVVTELLEVDYWLGSNQTLTRQELIFFLDDKK